MTRLKGSVPNPITQRKGAKEVVSRLRLNVSLCRLGPAQYVFIACACCHDAINDIAPVHPHQCSQIDPKRWNPCGPFETTAMSPRMGCRRSPTGPSPHWQRAPTTPVGTFLQAGVDHG